MNIAEIKDKYTCLDYLGDRVIRKVANGYLARAPWREDEHPSLTISLNGRGWKDHATGDHGSVIDLAMRCLNTTDIVRACEDIIGNATPFSLPQPNSEYCEGKEKEAFTRFDTGPITSKGLYAYLHQRCINIKIAKQFLVEVHYSTKDPDDGTFIYTLGYPTDKGGYELRNALRKLSKAPKGITVHLNQENAPTVVFEGFMDMLSFATMCGGVRHNYVVLNSCAMKEAALEVLKTLQNQVYLCLDNDKGGDDATAFLVNALPSAIDIRSRFAPAKDVNEYLIKFKHKSNETK